MLGADGRYSSTVGEDANGNTVPGFTSTWGLGGQAELDSPFGDNVQVNIHGDLNEEWNDAPVTIHEGGTMTGVTGHLFLFPKDRIVLFDGGIQERRLMLRPLMPGDPSPASDQTLAWAGLDFNLWTDGKRVVRGESLDERLVRRTALTDAGVLAYRHYELWADLPQDFYNRISLYRRASIDNGSRSPRRPAPGEGCAEASVAWVTASESGSSSANVTPSTGLDSTTIFTPIALASRAARTSGSAAGPWPANPASPATNVSRSPR